MIGIIIQARTGSSRLPNKMILPFANNANILELIVNRIKEAELKIPIILATTLNSGDEILEKTGQNLGIEVYRGSENNVLERFINAAETNKLTKIIRICADNPFLDIKSLKAQVEAFKESDVDYWCYALSDRTPTIKTHYGFWTEGVKLSALKTVANTTSEKLYIEHVTNFIYSHPGNFNIHYETISNSIENEKDIRLTIDTLADFELAQEIYTELIKNKISISAGKVIKSVNKRPEWLAIMHNEINRNSK